MKLYALRLVKNKRYLAAVASSNEEYSDCNECSYELDEITYENEYSIWVVTDVKLAQYVRQISTPWYNSDSCYPINPYKPDEIEIIELTSEEVIQPIELPTDYDVAEKLGYYIRDKNKAKELKSYSYQSYLRYLERING